MVTALGSSKVLLVDDNEGRFETLRRGLSSAGVDCTVVSMQELGPDAINVSVFDILYVTIDGKDSYAGILKSVDTLDVRSAIPVIAILSGEALARVESLTGIDDFVAEPWDVAELLARTKRVLRSKNPMDGCELVVRGDLTINITECEVYVADSLIELTYREYELLRFLASNPGRVFSRDALLNKVWGYDYFGGDRTVDVHIRRLRSKIEDENHTFIETVRNIGYRFRKDL